jgi:hypothetical protein
MSRSTLQDYQKHVDLISVRVLSRVVNQYVLMRVLASQHIHELANTLSLYEVLEYDE